VPITCADGLHACPHLPLAYHCQPCRRGPAAKTLAREFGRLDERLLANLTRGVSIQTAAYVLNAGQHRRTSLCKLVYDGVKLLGKVAEAPKLPADGEERVRWAGERSVGPGSMPSGWMGVAAWHAWRGAGAWRHAVHLLFYSMFGPGCQPDTLLV